jgi:two-component system chemotaxis response regulator CheB
LGPLRVQEAEDHDEVKRGHVLVAQVGFHMVLRRNGAGYCVTLKAGPKVCYQRPSVDVLFHSVAEVAGAKANGVVCEGPRESDCLHRLCILHILPMFSRMGTLM